VAAITIVDPYLVSPPAEGSHVIRGLATVDLVKGDPIVIANTAFDTRFDCAVKKATAETFIHGIVLATAKAGSAVEFLATGEMDGWSGMAPSTPLSVAGGKLDSAAPAAGAPTQIWALSATRIVKFY
jgi:hypothetical protein